MKKILFITILTLFLNIQFAGITYAAMGLQDYGGKTIPLKEKLQAAIDGEKADAATTGIIFVLQIITNALLYIAAPIAIAFIAYGGMSYAWSMGAQESLDAAKKNLIWACLGLLLIMMSYGIVRLIIATLLNID